jgi:hypothetical protein
MIPAFTIISAIITIAVTGVLVFVLYRINLPARGEVAGRAAKGGKRDG